jgi:mono/diheme cytochrome c family protein
VRPWSNLEPIVIGAAIALLALVPVGVVAFVKSGIYDVAASKPHTKLTEWITHETMIHSIRRHAQAIKAPRRSSGAQVMAGFCTYETHCVACHGAPAIAREQWVSGLEPSPPYLLDATSHWSSAELFWIVKHGIKMTGMPSWRDSMSDRQVWDVVAFLEAMRHLPPQTYANWRSPRMCGGFNGPWPAPEPRSTPRPSPAPPTAATGG